MQGNMSDFIDDGYSEDGYIAAVAGVHGPLTFKYRPAMGQLVDKATALAGRDEWDKFWDLIPKALARDPKLLLEWDETDSKGQLVQITEANLKRIRDMKFHKIWSIIAGLRISDPLPDGTKVGRAVDLENDSKN